MQFWHAVEIQSEYWRAKQASLLISLTHYWQDDEIKTDVNVYVSADKSHDTLYFQHAFDAHAKRYADKLGASGFHYVTTDGAPSHFKNRHSIAFLKRVAAAQKNSIMWSFNAPSHGPFPLPHTHTHTSHEHRTPTPHTLIHSAHTHSQFLRQGTVGWFGRHDKDDAPQDGKV